MKMKTIYNSPEKKTNWLPKQASNDNNNNKDNEQ